MEERLDKHIRISSEVKSRLDVVKNQRNYNSYIKLMLDYFDATCTSPQIHEKSPILKISRRIEDIIKIIRCQERDFFNPILDGIRGNSIPEAVDQLAANKTLLISNLDGYDKNVDYRNRLKSLVGLINLICQNNQFSRSSSGTDYLVPESFFEKLKEKVNTEYGKLL